MKELFNEEELELIEKYTGKKEDQILIGGRDEEPVHIKIDNLDEVDEILYDIL